MCGRLQVPLGRDPLYSTLQLPSQPGSLQDRTCPHGWQTLVVLKPPTQVKHLIHLPCSAGTAVILQLSTWGLVHTSKLEHVTAGTQGFIKLLYSRSFHVMGWQYP